MSEATPLMTWAGSPVGYGKARETAEEGVYKVVVRYKQEEVGRAALEAARRLILAAIADEVFDVDAEVIKLRELLHETQLGPSTRAIVEAGVARIVRSRIDGDSRYREVAEVNRKAAEAGKALRQQRGQQKWVAGAASSPPAPMGRSKWERA